MKHLISLLVLLPTLALPDTLETSLSVQVGYITYNDIGNSFIDDVSAAFDEISPGEDSGGSYLVTGLSDSFGLAIGFRRPPLNAQLSLNALTTIEFEGQHSRLGEPNTYSTGFGDMEGTFTHLSLGYEVQMYPKVVLIPMIGASYFQVEGEQTIIQIENEIETNRETSTLSRESTSLFAGAMVSYQFNPKIRGDFYMHKIFADDTTSNIGAAIGYVF